jgi:hypothetical protein
VRRKKGGADGGRREGREKGGADVERMEEERTAARVGEEEEGCARAKATAAH